MFCAWYVNSLHKAVGGESIISMILFLSGVYGFRLKKFYHSANLPLWHGSIYDKKDAFEVYNVPMIIVMKIAYSE